MRTQRGCLCFSIKNKFRRLSASFHYAAGLRVFVQEFFKIDNPLIYFKGTQLTTEAQFLTILHQPYPTNLTSSQPKPLHLKIYDPFTNYSLSQHEPSHPSYSGGTLAQYDSFSYPDHVSSHGFFYTAVTCSANFNISSWLVKKEIGHGAFGRVFLTIFQNQAFAVKCSKPKKKQSLVQMKNEVELLKELSHPNVVQYIAFQIMENGTAFLAMEFLERGSLADEIKKSGAINLKKSRSCAKQILAALIYIHQKSIIHRDIKCANCLLDQNENVKLSDFGLATRFVENDVNLTSFVGTPYFMAPEVIESDRSYTLSADIWSFACTVV